MRKFKRYLDQSLGTKVSTWDLLSFIYEMFCIEVCELQEGVYEWTEEIRLEILGLLPGNRLAAVRFGSGSGTF